MPTQEFLNSVENVRSSYKFLNAKPDGKFTGNSGLTLLGAEKNWQKNANRVFLIQYRLCGTREDIEKVLISQEIDPKSVMQHIITLENYKTTQSELYEDEKRCV